MNKLEQMWVLWKRTSLLESVASCLRLLVCIRELLWFIAITHVKCLTQCRAEWVKNSYYWYVYWLAQETLEIALPNYLSPWQWASVALATPGLQKRLKGQSALKMCTYFLCECIKMSKQIVLNVCRFKSGGHYSKLNA